MMSSTIILCVYCYAPIHQAKFLVCVTYLALLAINSFLLILQSCNPASNRPLPICPSCLLKQQNTLKSTQGVNKTNNYSVCTFDICWNCIIFFWAVLSLTHCLQEKHRHTLHRIPAKLRPQQYVACNDLTVSQSLQNLHCTLLRPW